MRLGYSIINSSIRLNPGIWNYLNMIKQTPKKMVPGMISIAALIALSREIVEILP